MIFGIDGLSPTPAELRRPEEAVLSTLGGVSMVWSGRAATALYWAYRIARNCGSIVAMPEIIVPAISCLTPATCAHAAGCQVRFADVDPESGMITLDTVRKCWTAQTKAVVFIHLYGQTADLAPLAAWCREQGIILIEDLAQAQGARLPGGAPAGSVGELVVYSFNRTKILEAGGGAMVFRSQSLADLWREIVWPEASQPEMRPDVRALLALSQRDLYHALISLRRLELVPDISSAFLGLLPAYSSLYLQPLRDPVLLSASWDTVPHALEERERNAAVYSSRLHGGPWQLLDGWRSSGVCWRYTLLVDSPDRLVEFTNAIRKSGFFASNLYWPLNELLRPEDPCPSAESFGRRVVNLWVDQTVTPARASSCADSLLTHAPLLAAADLS